MSRYVTAADVQVYYPFDVLDQDSITEVIERMSEVVKTTLVLLTGDPLFDFAAYAGPATTRDVQGSYSPYLKLPAHQAGSVTQVQEVSPVDGTLTTVDAGTYTERPDGRLYRTSHDMWGASPILWNGRYRVTAIWGYGEAPPDVQEVVIELVVTTWKSRDKGSWTDVIGVEGAGVIQVDAGMTGAQHRILQNVAERYTVVTL